MPTINPGDRAPDIRLASREGSFWLADVVGKKTVVLYFYPKDDTPGCTVEACGFRDSYEQFLAAGAVVIGVSQDSLEAHERFQARYQLPFTLLSDPHGQAALTFGVKKTLGLLAGRTTFVIGRDGLVKLRFDSQVRVNAHVKRALELVQALEAQAPPGR